MQRITAPLSTTTAIEIGESTYKVYQGCVLATLFDISFILPLVTRCRGTQKVELFIALLISQRQSTNVQFYIYCETFPAILSALFTAAAAVTGA